MLFFRAFNFTIKIVFLGVKFLPIIYDLYTNYLNSLKYMIYNIVIFIVRVIF